MRREAPTSGDGFPRMSLRSCGLRTSARYHPENLPPIRRLSLIEQRPPRVDEHRLFRRRQLHDLAALCLDGAPRLAVLLDREAALERDRVGYGLPHRGLQVGGPSVERGPMQE